MKKKAAKQIVLPHSQAKLDLFRSYLEKYLPILTLAKGISKINLYDIFCGIGLYEDGNIGSPLITVNTITKTNELIDSNRWVRKPVVLNINDGSKAKVENVKVLLESRKATNCTLNFYNLDADVMLDIAANEIETFPNSERNLVFIDPYGYSHIAKDKILRLLNKGHTEIVLFLPAMQMYRFSDVVFDDFERKCYEDLRKFIIDFLPEAEGFQSVFDFINELTKAFSFSNRYFSCSHYIERDKGNYYAVFFITSNIYGLERMLEVKWKADPAQGKGFKNSVNASLFAEVLVEYDRKIQLDFLKDTFIQELRNTKVGLSNIETYMLALKNEFLPRHINSVIKDLKKQGRLITMNKIGSEINIGNAFYTDYDHYKKNDIKVYYKLK